MKKCLRTIPLKKLVVGVTILDFSDHPPAENFAFFRTTHPQNIFRGVVTPSTNFFNGIALSISVVVMQKKDLMGISAVYSSFGMTLTVKQSVQTTDYNSILGVIPKKVC